MNEIYKRLKEIVGEQYVSNRPEELFFYSRDAGTTEPCFPDFVVMPESAEQVGRIVTLANEKKVPITPMGAALVLSGLSRPLRGGIVLDMKRMDRILEVNEVSRYAVVEAGTPEGKLQAYLARHYPHLKHSVPDAPPMATIGGNILIHGSGHLSALGGFHTEMLNGLEVVLPTGEIVRIGSCSVSPYWSSRAPLPDLAGLFLGWAGTTGIATKIAVKLYPHRPINDIDIFVTEDADSVPDVIRRLSGTAVAEDMTAVMTPVPEWASGFVMINVIYGAETRREQVLKRDLLRESVRKYIDDKSAGFMPLYSDMKGRFMEAPASQLVRFADVRKGGGFEYVGAIMPIEVFPDAYRAGLSIAERHGVTYSTGARIIGLGHSMMFFYAYAFNRADPADVGRAQKALEETNEAALEIGGIPWKAEVPAQQGIIKRMDPNTFELMGRIRKTLDPNGIMNPGNWEVPS
jgi:FAD/FMN-containing dehydrogenase